MYTYCDRRKFRKFSTPNTYPDASSVDGAFVAVADAASVYILGAAFAEATDAAWVHIVGGAFGPFVDANACLPNEKMAKKGEKTAKFIANTLFECKK